MRPNLLQASRSILTTILTALGVGLFIAVSVRAAHQVTDRQYTDGKQRTVPSSVPVLPLARDSAVANTARYATSLTRLTTNSDSQSTSATVSPFTPPAQSTHTAALTGTRADGTVKAAASASAAIRTAAADRLND